MRTLLKQVWNGEATTLKYGIAGGPTFRIDAVCSDVRRADLVVVSVELRTDQTGSDGLLALRAKKYRVTLIVEEDE